MFTESCTVPVERGCGTRAEGGIYAESGLGPNGLPIELFVPDRVVPVDGEAMGLSSIGVKLIRSKKTGVWNIYDIVGQEHYPNPTDWLEETRRYGASRRLSQSLPFHLLTSASRMIVLHRRAYIQNYQEYYDVRDLPRPSWEERPDLYFWQHCPHAPEIDTTDLEWIGALARRGLEGHTMSGAWNKDRRVTEFCPGLWWEDLTIDDHHDETRTAWVAKLRNERDAAVHMPAFSYYGRKTPYGVRPVYKLAVMAIMPITNLVVVDGGTDRDAINNLEAAGFAVDDPEACADGGKMPVFTVSK